MSKECGCYRNEDGSKVVPCDDCMDKMHGYVPRKIARPTIELNPVYTICDNRIIEYEAEKIIRDINDHFKTMPVDHEYDTWKQYRIILKRIN